ncbi:VWA domain-containing protein [Halopseudomonas sp.]|uniref:VWA domain-containing protein n=1 Tax=Halopseudomonas sp. TaxID=2901191 RepID=UPI0030034054
MPVEIHAGLTLTRPLWLLLLVPCVLLCWLLYRRINHYSPWHSLLPAVMRNALLQRQPGKDHAGRFLLLAVAWTVALLALSGPVWEGESPVLKQNRSALVVVLDLSHNMLANDLKPTRLERAKLKIRDLLQMRSDSQVALIAYAGSAHRVTPLTTDQATLINLLAGLSPAIMPASGTDPGSALRLAESIIAPLPREGTQILLITGSVEGEQLTAVAEAAVRLGRQLSILGAGTAEGAPVALPEGGFMRDEQGRIILPRLDNQALASIARRTGASYHDITGDDRDLLSLLQPLALTRVSDPERTATRSDQGHWLILLLLPLAALGARRGWLGVLLCAFLLPTTAEASPAWQDLWQRPDQQAADLLASDQPAAAARRFEDPHWAAWALYQAADYAAAAAAYEQLVRQDPDNPQYHFDHGTALAMSGKLQDALEAYEQTLTRAPDHAAARHNRSRIEALIEEQARQAAEQEQTASDSATDQAGTQAQLQDSSTEPDSPSRQPAESAGDTRSIDQTEAEVAETPSANTGSTQSASAAGANGRPAASDDSPTTGAAGVEETDDGDSQAAVLPATEQEPEPTTERPESLPETPTDSLDPEQQAALEQWLREVPDNPTDLLRRKFLYQRLQQLEERSR